MGRWGENFFEGDSDLDIASFISEDAGIELYSYEINTNPKYESGGRGLEATRDHLNNGVLSRLFKQYTAQKTFHDGLFTRSLGLIFLAALAMRVGGIIEPEYMESLRDLVSKVPISPKFSFAIFDSGFRGPMKRQFEIALARYKNDRTPYDFDAPRCALKGCDKAEGDLLNGGKLMNCGKCKVVVYCSKDCQRGDWTSHKKTCKTPEEHAAAATHGGIQFMNV